MAGEWAKKASHLLGERGRELYRIAFALTGERGSAERLLREGLGKAFKAAKRKSTPEQIAVIARRALYATFLQSTKWRTDGKKGKEASDYQTPAPKDRFLAALDVLEPHQRLCLVMRFYEGFSPIAIGKDLDVLPVTVRRYLGEAIKALGRPLHDLGLTEKVLHEGGWNPDDPESDLTQEVPQDTLSMGFTRVDELASADSPLPPHPETPHLLLRAATYPRRGRSALVVFLAVAAVGGLGVGGWAFMQASTPAGVAVSPSPTLSSAYGSGVLASDDVLGGSEPWTGGVGVQRILVCDTESWTPETSPDGIPVNGTIDGQGSYEDYDIYAGSCAQRQTDATAISATIVPFESTSGLNAIQAIVTIRNDGAHPIAILEDSVGLYFELPWEALSFLPASDDEALLYLRGSGVDDPELLSMAVLSDDATVLAPGEETSYTFHVWVLPDDFASYIPEEQTAQLTPEIVEEIRRSSSLVGELSEDDSILDAYRSGDYVPQAGLAITVAPSDPESTELVILWMVNAQVGAPPGGTESSPSPSASPSPTGV